MTDLVFVHETYTAAAFALNADLADGKFWQEASRDRMLAHLGLIGSVNAGDCKVEVYFGDVLVGSYANTLGGAAGAGVGLENDHVRPLQSRVVLKAGVPIHLKVVTAATTNPVQLYLDLRELPVQFNRPQY